VLNWVKGASGDQVAGIRRAGDRGQETEDWGRG
jgi:hypothetical protein